jgi:lysophospholipase L1-like esterase
MDGFIVGKNQPGIQYHVIGINGAHYSDFNKSVVFFQEMKLLQADLILVSLGTNEAVSSNITAQNLEIESTKFISNIRAAGVTCPIALVTPFDNYYRRNKPNYNIKKVQQGLLNSANKNEIACMDMYRISGGFGSATQWRNHGLIISDRIHYSAAGYRMQGKMIFNTLINSYLKYAKH